MDFMPYVISFVPLFIQGLNELSNYPDFLIKSGSIHDINSLYAYTNFSLITGSFAITTIQNFQANKFNLGILFFLITFSLLILTFTWSREKIFHIKKNRIILLIITFIIITIDLYIISFSGQPLL